MNVNSIKQQSAGYEKKDINIPLIAAISIGSIIVLVTITILLYNFFILQKEDMVYNTVLSQTSKELMELRQVEFEKLNGYKLIDPENGVYQIPIERAMQLISQGK